jgi:uncharacterized BrkB/YihY/UPF0761 family membrane protein
MSKRNKVIVSIFSGAVFLTFLFCINWLRQIINALNGNWEAESFRNEIIKQYIPVFIFIALSLFTVILFNFIIWFKISIPLTPEQAAERKRIKQERKKARLQEKLNKMN